MMPYYQKRQVKHTQRHDDTCISCPLVDPLINQVMQNYVVDVIETPDGVFINPHYPIIIKDNRNRVLNRAKKRVIIQPESYFEFEV